MRGRVFILLVIFMSTEHINMLYIRVRMFMLYIRVQVYIRVCLCLVCAYVLCVLMSYVYVLCRVQVCRYARVLMSYVPSGTSTRALM